MSRYRKVIDSLEWKERVEAIKTKRGNRCESCGRTDCDLDAHHLTYSRLGKEMDEDILILCRPCHILYHDKYPSGKMPKGAPFQLKNHVRKYLKKKRRQIRRSEAKTGELAQ